MFNNHIPMFTNVQLCAEKGVDPEWWHPQELAGHSRKWSHTPEANLARDICNDCPALRECREYALGYYNLTGIWGGLDRIERHNIQKVRHMDPMNWTDTWDSSAYKVPHERKDNVQG